ncbi:MAG: ORF6N domain-containing protein [Pseudomonadota bacterium]|nr:ORF6N domain-containing protein [Pseudomonadota bacterium]
MCNKVGWVERSEAHHPHATSNLMGFAIAQPILPADLAELYGVPTKRFNEQVKRNLARFPLEFMFQLTAAEKKEVVANCDHLARLKYSPHAPYAFTEHGAIMAATILNSPKAVAVGAGLPAIINGRFAGKPAPTCVIDCGRRSGLARDATRPFAGKPAPTCVIDAIRQLTAPPNPKKRPIGFITDREENA